MDLAKIKDLLEFLGSLFNVFILAFQLKDIYDKKHKKKSKKSKSKRKRR
ncbi:hypothetical protein [Clostridium botulinum]